MHLVSFMAGDGCHGGLDGKLTSLLPFPLPMGLLRSPLARGIPADVPVLFFIGLNQVRKIFAKLVTLYRLWITDGRIIEWQWV